MSVTIEASQLARALKDAAAVVEGRNTIPILSNVLLVAGGGELQVVTSNLDVEYRQTLPVAVDSDLATTVDAKRLAMLAGACAQGAQMSLALEDGKLLVKSGRSRWRMPVLPVADFPRLPFAEQYSAIKVPAAGLNAMLQRVMWARCTDEHRYYLNGPLFHGNEGKLRLAATNGHTLAVMDCDIAWPEGAAEIILMPKFCAILQGILGDASGLVTLEWDSKKVRATIGTIALTAKAIDGSFPDYRRVIPRESERCVIDPAQLRAAVRRCMLLAKDKTNGIRIDRRSGAWDLSFADPDCGSSKEEVAADTQGTTATGFNALYLDQICAACGGDSITIDHADDRAPALVRRAVPDGFTGVIMPVRI